MIPASTNSLVSQKKTFANYSKTQRRSIKRKETRAGFILSYSTNSMQFASREDLEAVEAPA
jgi:hypothetical protein